MESEIRKKSRDQVLPLSRDFFGYNESWLFFRDDAPRFDDGLTGVSISFR